MSEENMDENGPASLAPNSLRFETAPYCPDGGCPALGTMLTAGASFAIAIGLGWLVSFIGQWLYLILIFPFVMGLIIGKFGEKAVQAGKVRNPFMAGLLGLAAGILGMISSHFFDYQRFLSEIEAEIPGARAAWDQMGNFFFTYIDGSAQQGVTIAHAGADGGGGGMNLGYIGSYIYWLIEMGIVAGVSWGLMKSASSKPFCTGCMNWKETRKLGRLGMTDPSLVDDIKEGALVELTECNFNDETSSHFLRAAVCATCGTQSPVDVQFVEITTNKDGKEVTKELAHVTYPGQALKVLEALTHKVLSSAPPPNPPEPSELPATSQDH